MSNVHNILHIVDDIKLMGNLNTFNAYPFENMLGQIKRLICSGNNPLEQVANRLSELSTVCSQKIQYEQYPMVKLTKTEEYSFLNSDEYFCKIELQKGLSLSLNATNKWFLTKELEIVQMIMGVKTEKNYSIYGSSIKNLFDTFDAPVKSSYININSTHIPFQENEPTLGRINKT